MDSFQRAEWKPLNMGKKYIIWVKNTIGNITPYRGLFTLS